MAALNNLKIAMLVADGFEQSELTDPKKALEDAGAQVDIVSFKSGKVKGWKHTQWGDEFTVDVTLDDVASADYAALVLPGGVMNPDKLRADEKAVQFVKEFIDTNKPIAAICHGPWTLINAKGVKGKTMTSYKSIKLDLENAGAKWVDKEVVADGNLITSRKPADIPAFNKEMIKIFSQA